MGKPSVQDAPTCNNPPGLLLPQSGRTAAPPADGMVLHHIGCAVRSIEKALAYYTGALGFRKITEPIEVPSQRVRVCFIDGGSGVYVELVEGIGAGSPVEGLLSHTGGGPYHLCFRVPDLDAAIARLRGQGFFRLKRFELAAHGMRRFAFMLTPDRQLLELCEPDRL